MKTINDLTSRAKLISLFLILLIFFTKFSCHGQDLIVLQSGEEIDVKIISKKGQTFNYILWEDQENLVRVIDKKFVKRHRMEYLTKERVSFSFSFGGVPYGTSTSLKNYMKENGYEGTSKSWFGPIDYPVSHVKISWMLEFEYLIKPPHGFSIEFAQTNKGSVTGYGTPEVSYSNPQVSVSYKYYLKYFKSNLQAGLILSNTKIEDSDGYGYSMNDSEMSGGFLLGYAGSIVENEKFFLRFQTQFRFVFPIELSNSDLFLDGEKIGLSHLFIGIQTGIKIAKNK